MIGIIIGLILLGVVLIWEIVSFSTLGSPKSDEEILEFLNTLKNNQPSENEYPDEYFRGKIGDLYKSKILDGSMIYTFNKPYISKTIQGLTFGCYINGMGVVPRWYKSHSEIKKLFKELKK